VGLGLLLATVVCCTSLALSPQRASAAVPPSGFFGVGGWSNPTPTQASSLAGAGLRLVRGAVGWGQIQPTSNPSSRNWSYTDQLANEAAADGFNIVFVLNGCAVWACGTVLAPPTGSELNAYENFVQAAVARYDPSSPFWKGKPHVPTITWQVWNEVNAGYFWPNPTPASYATFLAQISQTIKAVQPSANVIMSGLTAVPSMTGNGIALTPFLQALYQQPGFPQDTSAIVVHGYAGTPAASVQILDQARSVMLQNNDAAQPIWVTEMSWASGGPASAFTVTPALQATYLTQSWETMLACAPRWNLQHVLWFGLQDVSAAAFDEPDYWGFNNGLINLDGSAKPSYWSFLHFVGSAPLPDGAGDTCTLPGGDTLDGESSAVGAKPTATIELARHSSTNPHWQPVSFAATENGQAVSGVIYECSLDHTRWRRCSSPFNAASKHQGANTLRVKAIAVHHDLSVKPASLSWVVALRPPETLITAHNHRGGIFMARFRGETAAGVAAYECRLSNGQPWLSCSNPYKQELAPGTYTFYVRAIDRAGNADPHPASVSFTIYY
jgi:hypothetical protein